MSSQRAFGDLTVVASPYSGDLCIEIPNVALPSAWLITLSAQWAPGANNQVFETFLSTFFNGLIDAYGYSGGAWTSANGEAEAQTYSRQEQLGANAGVQYYEPGAFVFGAGNNLALGPNAVFSVARIA